MQPRSRLSSLVSESEQKATVEHWLDASWMELSKITEDCHVCIHRHFSREQLLSCADSMQHIWAEIAR